MILKTYIGEKLEKTKYYYPIKYAFKPHGYIRNFITFPIFGWLRTKGIGYKEDQHILDFKDKHKGERAFVIATGPSLILEDILAISNETTFAVNSIFRMYEKTDWRPNYYVFLDPHLYDRFYERGFIDLDSYCKDACFLNALNRKRVSSSKACILHTNWLNHATNYGSKLFRFHEDYRFGLYDFYSVTHSSILLAMYMGFKEIYLLGADNNYLGDKIHFQTTAGETEINKDRGLQIQDAMDSAYAAIKEIADERGIKIYNATRGGRLEVYPRVNLNEVVK